MILTAAWTGLILLASCREDFHAPDEPAQGGDASPRLILSADVTSGTVPLTVNFTGSLRGRIDTLFTKVPEISFLGGYNPEEQIYTPLTDTLAGARPSYIAREHYFHQGTYRAVMIVHGVHGDIVSDSLTVRVQ